VYVYTQRKRFPLKLNISILFFFIAHRFFFFIVRLKRDLEPSADLKFRLARLPYMLMCLTTCTVSDQWGHYANARVDRRFLSDACCGVTTLKMARKPVKLQKENPAGCAGEGKQYAVKEFVYS